MSMNKKRKKLVKFSNKINCYKKQMKNNHLN